MVQLLFKLYRFLYLLCFNLSVIVFAFRVVRSFVFFCYFVCRRLATKNCEMKSHVGGKMFLVVHKKVKKGLELFLLMSAIQISCHILADTMHALFFFIACTMMIK